MLSERDTLTLAAIERRLIGDDPVLAHLFDRRCAPLRWRRARSRPFPALIVVSLLLMVVFTILALPIALLICVALLPCALTAHLCWTGTLLRPRRSAAHRRAR